MRVPFSGILKNPGCLVNIKPKVCGQMSNSSCSGNSSTTATRKSNNQIILSSNQIRLVMCSRSLNPVYPPFVFLGDGEPQKPSWCSETFLMANSICFFSPFLQFSLENRPSSLPGSPQLSMFFFYFYFSLFLYQTGQMCFGWWERIWRISFASLGNCQVKEGVVCVYLICLLMCSVCTENNRLLGLKVWAAEWVTDCDISVYTRLLASD